MGQEESLPLLQHVGVLGGRDRDAAAALGAKEGNDLGFIPCNGPIQSSFTILYMITRGEREWGEE